MGKVRLSRSYRIKQHPPILDLQAPDRAENQASGVPVLIALANVTHLAPSPILRTRRTPTIYSRSIVFPRYTLSTTRPSVDGAMEMRAPCFMDQTIAIGDSRLSQLPVLRNFPRSRATAMLYYSGNFFFFLTPTPRMGWAVRWAPGWYHCYKTMVCLPTGAIRKHWLRQEGKGCNLQLNNYQPTNYLVNNRASGQPPSFAVSNFSHSLTLAFNPLRNSFSDLFRQD